MGRQKYMYAQKKNKQPIVRLLGAIFGITIICIGTLYGYERFSNPQLYGSWESVQTGEVIEFSKDGTIVLEESLLKPTFEIIAPGKMVYTIEDKVFKMHYTLEGRQLAWGVEGEVLEQFMRK